MDDYISKLPDDILCYMFSYLTVRDAAKARSLSSRWRDIPDCRSVFRFDAFTVFGEHSNSSTLACRSEFVKAVNQFLKIWNGRKISRLEIKFHLGNEYASHIDGWIASVIGKEVEELDLDFTQFSTSIDKYVFPCHLLHTGKASYLKHLRLLDCDLKLLCHASTSWLSHLATLELNGTRLGPNELELVLTSTPNLKSLTVISCSLGTSVSHLCVRHPSLQKLIIDADLLRVELCCPHLEIFKYDNNRAKFTFSHVPVLRQVCILFSYDSTGCSSVFCDLTKYAHQLHAFTLRLTTEVQTLPVSITTYCLKRLELLVRSSKRFDLLSVTHLINASPFLETLHIKLSPPCWALVKVFPKRHYPDHLHFQLKEVIIEGFCMFYNEMEFVEYLLKNVVALQQIVVVWPLGLAKLLRVFEPGPFSRFITAFITKLRNTNSKAKLIIK